MNPYRYVSVVLSQADRGLIQLNDTVYYKEMLNDRDEMIEKELVRILPGQWTTYYGKLHKKILEESPKQVIIHLFGRFVTANISEADLDIPNGERVYYKEMVNNYGEVVGKKLDRNVRAQWKIYQGNIYQIYLKRSPIQVAIYLAKENRYININIGETVSGVSQGDEVYYMEKFCHDEMVEQKIERLQK